MRHWGVTPGGGGGGDPSVLDANYPPPPTNCSPEAPWGGGGGVGTRPWWLALLACGGAYWPRAFEPSAMKSRHPYYCGHPHCRGGGGLGWVGLDSPDLKNATDPSR